MSERAFHFIDVKPETDYMHNPVLKSSSFYTSNKPESIKNNTFHHNACYITECTFIYFPKTVQ